MRPLNITHQSGPGQSRFPRAAALLREAAERVEMLEGLLRDIIKAGTSHVDGRDLLAELHQHGWPHEIDIKTRKDAIDRWYEGDWLKAMYKSVRSLRAALGDTP